MKLKNIFKKKTQVTAVSADIQKLEKNQLSQINGGVDSDDSTTTDPSSIKYVGGGGKAQGIMGSK